MSDDITPEYDDNAGSLGGGNSVTEVTYTSWFQKLSAAIGGVLFGIVLFLVSFPLLWWNEGRSVKTAQGLEELGGAVHSVAADAVDPANDKKPVHLTGEATTDETLSDPSFPILVKAIKLRRNVEMYQWKERKETTSRDKVGGGTERRTTYHYEKVWSDELINSGSFHQSAGHSNPTQMAVTSNLQTARDVRLGAFTLSSRLVGQMNDFQPILLTGLEREKLPTELRESALLQEQSIYLPVDRRKDAATAHVGDLRVTFAEVKPAVVSVVAQQAERTFEPWRAKSGATTERLMLGAIGSSEMIAQMEKENTMLTWALRALGAVLMSVGIGLVFNPLKVLGDVIPLVGDLIGMGIGLFAAVLGLSLSLTTIAIAWIAYRPVLGVLLLVAAVGIVVLFKMLRRPRYEATVVE